MKTFTQLIEESRDKVNELFPWDLTERMANEDFLIVDIREPYEFDAMHIKDSINVPRGILETACEFDYEETVPELAASRKKNIVLVCRSGNRTIFAADIMQQMGFQHVWSLNTGLRGWNDFEQPLVDNTGAVVDLDKADEYFAVNLREDQKRPE